MQTTSDDDDDFAQRYKKKRVRIQEILRAVLSLVIEHIQFILVTADNAGCMLKVIKASFRKAQYWCQYKLNPIRFINIG